jgi:ParB family chromosome partitioning protein
VATTGKGNTNANSESRAVMIPTDRIEPNCYNARKGIDPDALKELAQNIASFGVIQPVTVRPKVSKDGGERYEVVCGERRFRACMTLNLATIPAIVRELTDEQAYDLSISENLQREDVPPMEAAEAYKHLIETKRYDVATLALQFGKGEKHVRQMLKLCELIPAIADLVRKGKMTASAGIVIAKYDPKVQETILNEQLGKDGQGEWCHLSAVALERKIESWYTNDLADYHFDKTECLKCGRNSANYDLFADGSACGKCADKNCLKAKQTAHLVAEAEKIAKADPKMVFIGDKHSGNEATRKFREAGHELKNVHTYTLKTYPTAPTAPQASEYKKPEDFDRAQAQYNRAQETYTKETAQLDALKAQGKIRTYGEIGDNSVKIHYKEVNTQDTKTNEQLIADWTAQKERNDELAREKTAGDIRELLTKQAIPRSAWTAQEEAMMYYFMLSKLRRGSYPAVGLKDSDYWGHLSDEKKQKLASTLTEEQKTAVRRDYLYSHLTSGVTTTANVQGGLMLAFAKHHLPVETAKIEATHKEDYGKKNARLDERIADLKKQEKQAKADAKAPKQEQTAKVAKPAETGNKGAKGAKKATATPTVEAPKATTKPTNGKATTTKTAEAKSKPTEIAKAIPTAPITAPADTDGKAKATAPTNVTAPDKGAGDGQAKETATAKTNSKPTATATPTTESAKAVPTAPIPAPAETDGKPTATAPDKGKSAPIPPAGTIHIVGVPPRKTA